MERNLVVAAPRNIWPYLHEFLASFPLEKEGFGLDLWTFFVAAFTSSFHGSCFPTPSGVCVSLKPGRPLSEIKLAWILEVG